MPIKQDTDAPVTRSRQNFDAARLIVAARERTGLNQTDFASALARRLGLSFLSQQSLSGWEKASRQVPAAAMIAAAEEALEHGYDLAGALAGRLARAPRPPRRNRRDVADELDALAAGVTDDVARDRIRETAKRLRQANGDGPKPKRVRRPSPDGDGSQR